MAKQRVLLDSCVIIEAFRTNCWKALCQHFDVETVQCCVDECCAGDKLRPGRIDVPRQELLQGLARVHDVSDLMLATLSLSCDDLPALDDGERHMMAWLYAHPAEAVITSISTADRAAIRASYVLCLVDRVVSLQQLAKTAGSNRKQLGDLEHQFTEDWLGTVRMQLKLGVL